jgi:hypothetical protein
VIHQLREAFPYNPTAKYLIFDRAANFNEEVVSTIKSFGIEPKRTSFRSPWQNGVAERFDSVSCSQLVSRHETPSRFLRARIDAQNPMLVVSNPRFSARIEFWRGTPIGPRNRKL